VTKDIQDEVIINKINLFLDPMDLNRHINNNSNIVVQIRTMEVHHLSQEISNMEVHRIEEEHLDMMAINPMVRHSNLVDHQDHLNTVVLPSNIIHSNLSHLDMAVMEITEAMVLHVVLNLKAAMDMLQEAVLLLDEEMLQTIIFQDRIQVEVEADLDTELEMDPQPVMITIVAMLEAVTIEVEEDEVGS